MTEHIRGGWRQIASSRSRSQNAWKRHGGITGGGGGTVGGGWDWQDPPTRTNTVTHSSVGGSIQNALNGLSPDTTLVLDSGPYTTEFSLPSTDHITISGGTGGATINSPNNRTAHITGGGWTSTDTPCSAVAEGATTLSVGNAAVFAPGDDLLIHDQTDLYKGLSTNDLRNTGSQYKGEFCVVSSVDTAADTVTLTKPTHQHYNNPNGALEARKVNWNIEDIHWHNITLDGGVATPDEDLKGVPDLRGLSLNATKNVWITGSTFRNYHKDGYANNMVLHQYVDNCYATNYDRYGFSHSDGATHIRVRNCRFDDFHSYGVQCGGGATDKKSVPAPTYDVMAINCHADNTMRNMQTFVGDAHFASERVEYRDCTTADSLGNKIRGFDQHLIGGSFDCGGRSLVQSTQKIGQSSIQNLYCKNGARGWVFWPKEGHLFEDLLMAECQFENMSGTPFQFRPDLDDGGNPPDIENLRVVNSSWNGSWIDDAMVENSDGSFSSATITYSTEYPTNQTPAEYFV